MAEKRSPSIAVATVRTLRRALSGNVGEEEAARVLDAAGASAGDALYEALGGAAREERLRALPLPALVRRLSDALAAEGWGRLEHESIHPAVGVLESRDWAEAEDGGGASGPSCHLAAGLLARVLGRVGGGTVAVVEVSCRSAGDPACRFAFGAPSVIAALRRTLSEEHDLESALRRLEGSLQRAG